MANSHFPQTRSSIIHGLQTDAPDAWSQFFELYAPVVYRFAKHARLSDRAADEVLSTVMYNMVIAVRNGFELDREKGRFRHYFRKVVNRVIAAARHPKQDASSVDERSDPQDLDQTFAHIEASEYLNYCLKRLERESTAPVRHIEIFRQYVLEEQSPDQLARKFQISRARVYAIKNEITASLRTIHTELIDEMGA